jgi:hypothetical protein
VRRLAFVASLFLSLWLVPGASAKEFTKLVVVGAQGKYVELFGNELAPWNAVGPNAEQVAPTGSYLLLYPLMEKALPMRPGRYFPDVRIACFSWARGELGECGHVSNDFAVRLANARALPRFATEPTIVSRFILNGQNHTITSNGVVALELAFNTWRRAKPAPRPKFCTAATVAWTGPAASSRVTSFCVAARGIWSAGRLYRVPGVILWL